MRRFIAGTVTALISVGLSGLQPVGAATQTSQRLTHASAVMRIAPYHPQAAQTTSTGKLPQDSPDYTNDIGSDIPKDNNSRFTTSSSPTLPTVSPSSVQLTGTNTTVKGMNAYNHFAAHEGAYQVVPPDQGLCAGNGYIIEPVNMVIGLYNESTMAMIGSALPVETLFGTSFAFTAAGGVQGDVRCYWDADSGRWFVTQLWVENNTGRNYIMIATSTSATPDLVPADIATNWNITKIDVTDDGMDGTPDHSQANTGEGCPCLGDQPLLGADHNAIFITTNEFGLAAGTFNGVMSYVINKAALAAGTTANVQVNSIGLDMATPDGSCYTGTFPSNSNTGICWYSMEPAQSPWNGSAAATFASVNNGTEYALSALQFGDAGNFDNRISEWAYTNTSSISAEPGSVVVNQFTITSGVENYGFPFANCSQFAPGTCPTSSWIDQRPGPTPTYDVLKATHPDYVGSPHPNAIASNDDRMLQTVYANGSLYSNLNTVVNPTNSCGFSCWQTGQAWWKVAPAWSDGLIGSVAQQGYIAIQGADALFGAIGVTPSGSAVMSFSVTGHNYWPSSAYVLLPGPGGLGHAPTVHISAMGQSPEDSSTEYAGWNTSGWRPRFGDYGAAVADGGTVYFSSEYVQYANCSDTVFAGDMTCGGTRSSRRNWGTSVNKVSY